MQYAATPATIVWVCVGCNCCHGLEGILTFSQTTTMRGLRRIREWNFNFICHCASLRAQGQSANFCVLVVKLERRTGSQLYVAVRLLA